MASLQNNLPRAIEKYCLIMSQLNIVDVSKELEFQRFFNGYYRMRQRPQAFYDAFYSYLEQEKHNEALTFHEVLSYLYETTGILTPSFSSKLLATVRPEMPVWDKFVLQNLGLKAPYTYEKDRMQKVENLYQQIHDWYSSPEAQEKLQYFNQHYPGAPITDTKKIDFILWSTR